MDIYQVVQCDDQHVYLQELFTDVVQKTICTSKYEGDVGELWFVRLLPDRTSGDLRAITFTTPYILTAGLEAWEHFFERQRIIQGNVNKTDNYEKLLSKGLSPEYWLEFIHQAYSNVTEGTKAILLAGLPDIAATRPHVSSQYPGRSKGGDAHTEAVRLTLIPNDNSHD
jgi:hypothetical protein